MFTNISFVVKLMTSETKIKELRKKVEEQRKQIKLEKEEAKLQAELDRQKPLNRLFRGLKQMIKDLF